MIRSLAFALVFAAAPAFTVMPAFAQISGEAFSGFSGSDKPVQIDADALEVVDGENRAIFSGNVRVQQGDSVLETSELEVIYGEGGSNAEGGATPGNISRLNLSGGVIARSGPNVAQGERGSFDVVGEVVTLSGDVTLSQGDNVAKGCELVARLKTNTAKLTRCPGQRVRTVITPTSE